MNELKNYIFSYYQEFLTKQENQAHKNVCVQFKITSIDNELQKDLMRKRWLSHDEKVLKLLENGSEEFYRKTLEKVLKENLNKKLLNLCPKCNALAKTPKAKQCPKCFYSWHEEANR